MEMKPDENNLHKLEDGIWYMPTFKTNSAYIVESVTIIMEYKKFYEKMVLDLLSYAYEDISIKDNAAAFRKLYNGLREGNTSHAIQ